MNTSPSAILGHSSILDNVDNVDNIDNCYNNFLWHKTHKTHKTWQYTVGSARIKCLKVHIYYVLSFKEKQAIPFLSENCDFFGVFGRKTGRAGPTALKFSTKRNQVF